MGPKIEAALRVINNGGKRALITSIADIESALKGEAGTEIFKS
jgi:carbamate kinase